MTGRTILSGAGTSQAHRVRVLIADGGDQDFRDTVEVLCQRDCDCVVAAEGSAVVGQAVSMRPEVILLDAYVASASGSQVLRQLQGDHRTALIPVICVTSDRRSATVLELLAAGADDYVAKPFDPDELHARILVATRRRALLGGVSPLTGLPGNVLLTRMVQQRLDRQVPFAFLQVDVDNFKAFNDRYGYVRGDQVIGALADLLDAAAERIDSEETVIGHIGGDDFGVIARSEHAATLAEHVTDEFQQTVRRFYDPVDLAQGGILLLDRNGGERRYPIMSVSIGVALWTPQHPRSPEAVADMAAELKSVAKRHDGSYVAVDRRRL